MKSKERIIRIREQLNEKVPMENLWYFNEETAASYASSPASKPVKRDNLKINSNKDSHLVSIAHEKNVFKQDNSFVVDWQLSENI